MRSSVWPSSAWPGLVAAVAFALLAVVPAASAGPVILHDLEDGELDQLPSEAMMVLETVDDSEDATHEVVRPSCAYSSEFGRLCTDDLPLVPDTDPEQSAEDAEETPVEADESFAAATPSEPDEVRPAPPAPEEAGPAPEPGAQDAETPAPAPRESRPPSPASAGTVAVGDAPPAWPEWALAAAVLVPWAFIAKVVGSLLLGWRRGARPDSLRQAVLQAVEAQPGIRHAELVRRIGRGNGTVEHHLAQLLRGGQLQRVRRGRATAYYLGGRPLPADGQVQFALQGETARRVVEELQAEPGLSLVELAGRVGIAVSTAHHHVRRLAASGMVKGERHGPRLRLALARPDLLPQAA